MFLKFKNIFSLLKVNNLAIFLIVLVCTSCKNDNEPDNPSKDLTAHIEYFGFVLVDTYWDDPTDSIEQTNYTSEVSSFTNTGDILVTTPNDNIMSRIETMHNAGMKTILHLNEIFFEYADTNSLSGANYNLRSDFEQRWNTLMDLNNFSDNNVKISALYIGEEPTWNGISYTDLKAACDYAKATLPSVPIMIVEAPFAIDLLQVPQSADWVGFDHYFIKDPNTDGTYLQELELLKSKFSHPNQRFVMIMDTHYISWAHGDYGGIALNEMGEVAESYFALAKREPKTIAILGYYWPSGFEFNDAIGARGMPQAVRQVYSDIGKDITEK